MGFCTLTCLNLDILEIKMLLIEITINLQIKKSKLLKHFNLLPSL